MKLLTLIILGVFLTSCNDAKTTGSGKTCHSLSDFVPRSSISYSQKLAATNSLIKISSKSNTEWKMIKAMTIPGGRVINSNYVFKVEGSVIKKYPENGGTPEKVLSDEMLIGGNVLQDDDIQKTWVSDPCFEITIEGQHYRGVAISSKMKMGKREENTSYHLIGLGAHVVGMDGNSNPNKNADQWSMGTISNISR